MILLIYFVTVLGLGRSLDQIPSRLEIESSINRTIQEVERLISADPSLPKLSRSQIVDILDNITSQDMKTYEESVEQMRSNYERALMVVLPYNSKDSGEDLKDLYTKAPMVQVIPDSGTMFPFASIQEEPSPSQLNAKHSGNLQNQFGSSSEYKNHRLSYADVKLKSVPEKFSFDLNNLNPTTKSSSQKSNLEVVYSTSVTQAPVTKSTTPFDNEVQPTVPSTKSTVVILTSDQWRYNAPPSSTTPRSTTRTSRTTTHRPKTTTPSPATTSQASQTTKPSTRIKPFLPTVISDVPESAAPVNESSQAASEPSGIIAFDLADLKMMNDAPTAPLYVTPMSSSTTASSQLESTDRSVKPTPMREEVETLLASIGLRPQEETNEKLNGISEDDIFGKDFVLPESNIIPNTPVGLPTPTVDSPSISNQNTFENHNGDLGKGLSNLSPDVQFLFQRFGLPVSAKTTATTTTKKPETRPTAATNYWNSFRPLPSTEVKDEGMRKFLATFGLGTVENRHKKAMKATRSTVPSVIDAVPNDMKHILENIGLITKSKTSKPTNDHATEDPSKLHIFKPHETLLRDEKQKNDINQLLDTVKLVQEGKADVSDVRNIANEIMKSTKRLQNGPDPMSLEEILENYSQNLRNEVKRQESKNDSAPETTDSTDSEMSSATLSESSANSTTVANDTSPSDSSGNSSDSDGRIVSSGAITSSPLPSTESVPENFDDLADSFGGSTAQPDPVLPTPRKTGLYFLVDWNTFLEVGEEDKEKVNLRFAPKVGDKSRFISVTVP